MTSLLTSFDTWTAHQPSNSSDDLLRELQQRGAFTEECLLLRKLPVEYDRAPQRVIAKIQEVQPRLVLCCGMAERRSHLSIESSGTFQGQCLQTSVDLVALTTDLVNTTISHDAGQFVCNHLYYAVLDYIAESRLKTLCVFVHVPILNTHNLEPIVKDFWQMLRSLQALSKV